jgi:hypothetical protein
MPPVVIVSNGAGFSVCDLVATPTATVVALPATPGLPPATAESCVVAAAPNRVAAGKHPSVSGFATPGYEVHLYDISNPTSPVRLATATLAGFFGTGALAMQGSLVAAAEFGLSSQRVFLIDFTDPANPKVRTASTPVADISSLAFTGPNKVVGASRSGPPNCVEVDFSSPTTPIVTAFASPFTTGSAVLDADAAAGRIAIGEVAGGQNAQVALLNAGTKATVKGPIPSGLPGVTSIAISGTNVIAAYENARTFRRIDFAPATPSVTTIDPNWPPVGSNVGTGNVVALEGTTGACGQVSNVGTMPVGRFALPQTQVVDRIDSNIAPLESIAIAQLASAPPAPAIDVAASVQFGPVRAGTQAQQALTIGNPGTAPLTITSITSSDPQAFPLTLPALPLTVQPGGQTPLTVRFAPTSETNYSARLAITSNAPASPARVDLSGSGALPHIVVSPATLDLGSVFNCGITSLPKPVSIENTGDVPLTVSSITAGGPFSVSPTNVTVAPHATTDVSVVFTPAAQGVAAGTLTVVHDDPAKPTQTVALSGTGLPPQPPVAQVSPAAFNLGNVRRQYFSAMELTITNASACQNLIVQSLAVTGTGFSLTDTIQVTGATTLGPHNIPPNQTWKPLVVFAPTALGPATGTLIVTTNDPANPSLGPFTLSATGVDGPPAALELVLDRSGSMGDQTPGGTKMDDLKRTVTLFADVVIPGQGDEMGSVEFDDLNSALTPFGPYDAANQSQIKTSVNSLYPRGLTGIGAALQRAQGQLGNATVARRLILVFTDGNETGAPPSIAAVKPSILGAGIEAYAVGLGRPQDVSAAALSDLAWSSNGKFFQTEDPLLLRKHFVQVLVDAFRQNVATDPVQTINQGATLTVPVSLTDCERRVTFVLAWEDPNAQLGLEIEAPDGTVYTPTAASTNKLVRYGQDVTHRWYQVAFPPVDKPPGRILGPQRAGTWLMRVTGSQVSGRERLTTTVLVDSDLDLDVRVRGSDTTKPLVLEVRLDEPGSRLTSADVKVRTTSPTKSISEIYGTAALSKLLGPTVVDDLTGFSLLERASRALRSRRYNIPTLTRRPTLQATRGVYRLELPPPLVPGIYQFEVEVTGQACGGTFQRYASVSYYVAPVASQGTTGITITPGTGTTATVTVTPRTEAKQPLGPGLAQAIGGAVSGGRIESVVDQLDGSYLIGVRWSRRTRSPVLSLDVGGAKMKVPLIRRKRRRRQQRGRRRRGSSGGGRKSP